MPGNVEEEHLEMNDDVRIVRLDCFSDEQIMLEKLFDVNICLFSERKVAVYLCCCFFQKVNNRVLGVKLRWFDVADVIKMEAPDDGRPVYIVHPFSGPAFNHLAGKKCR